MEISARDVTRLRAGKDKLARERVVKAVDGVIHAEQDAAKAQAQLAQFAASAGTALARIELATAPYEGLASYGDTLYTALIARTRAWQELVDAAGADAVDELIGRRRRD